MKDSLMREQERGYAEEGFLREEAASEPFLAMTSKAFQTAQHLLQESSGIQKKWTHASGKVKHLVNPHRREAIFRDLMQAPEVLHKLRQVFGDTPLFVTHSKLSFKFSGADQVWLPHQDTAYKTHRSRLATVCVFLEACSDANGGLQFFPGSHKEGTRKHEILFAENESDPQIRVKELPPISPVTISGPAGTILVFDGNMIHQSGENRIGGVRAVFLFEVEPLRGFAMEADGQDAIVLNAGPEAARSGWRKPLVRGYRHFVEMRLKPLAKKVLFFLHRRLLRKRSGSLTGAKA